MTGSAPHGLLAALSAIRNASRAEATPAQIESILRTGRGDPSHVRALFGDVSFDTLIRLGLAFDIPTETILASYREAKRTAAAANAEIDAAGLA